MDDQLIAGIVGGCCLIWAVAAAAPGIPGRRRWREGVPGGRRALASALCGVAPPLFIAGLSVVRAVWSDEPPIWEHDAYSARFRAAGAVLALLWVASLVLIVAAAGAAMRAAENETPPPRPPKERR
ncbi:hypothetical protein [Alienimonas chondri]|uniref:Transmembrane protein n=1 Tax=Alienimonas chondri TaxID=2681879 RepID=A0ABX1VES3_9PLAN|nr:hypothetical protein [Alienimonas chondri]NNJ25787.1 hypothetical protein [Alienimonas chondri]